MRKTISMNKGGRYEQVLFFLWGSIGDAGIPGSGRGLLPAWWALGGRPNFLVCVTGGMALSVPVNAVNRH
jgi:hypothetical protein